ncbi:MAG: DUF2892 domain-containing protein [Dermatophilaceae bacterium]
MKLNVGNADRGVRVVIAVVAAILAITVTGGALDVILWVVAAIMLGTAAVGFCPLYRIFGMSTCKVPAGSQR